MVETMLFALVSIVIFVISGLERKQLQQSFEQEREAWAKERKDLMDRIQAPTFNEYTSKVIREKKAEQPEEEQPEVEFVS